MARVALAYLAGGAVLTLGMLALAFVRVPITRASVIGCVLACAVTGRAFAGRRGAAPASVLVAGPKRGSAPLLVLAGIALAAAAAIALLVGPVQIVDFFRAWGLRGVAIAHHNDLTFDGVSRNWQFYPLALSNLYAALYLLLGHADETVIRLPLLMFGLSLAGSLWWFARMLMPPAAAALALALAVATPQFVTATSNGLADVPVAAYLTVSALAASLWIRDGEPSWAALSGFGAGAAAWTKLEGLPAGLVILAAVVLVRRGRLSGIVSWLAWVAAFTIPWQVYQRVHDITFARAHFRRIFLDIPWIADHVTRTLLETTPWGVFWPLCVGTIALTAPYWWRTDARWIAAVTLPNLVVTAGAYVIHYRTGDASAVQFTAHRLYLHLAPSVAVMAAAAAWAAWPAAEAPLRALSEARRRAPPTG